VLGILNLSPFELVVIAVVAVIVFGPRLPQVAAEAAHYFGKLRRSLSDLRRETGIDREIEAARRAIEDAVPREVRELDVRSVARRELDEIRRETERPVETKSEPTPRAETEDPPEDP
jgi:Sec-independent protein translocase protein TatA